MDWLQLPQLRLPSLGKVERKDVVVFNYPPEFEHPKDLRTHYIKRCVALPGDQLEIKTGQVYINGNAQENPELMQHRYFVETDQIIRDRVFRSYKIWEKREVTRSKPHGYIVHTTKAVADELMKLDFIKSVTPQFAIEEDVESRIFPDARYFPWNADNYGPLEIPAKGKTIQITEEILAMYGSTIQDYEEWEEVDIDIENSSLKIDGQEVNEYTFKKDYYFMMGDNRHNSEDSRYWGFVPEDFIVGEASFIWMSFDDQGNFINKIRWDRLFNGID